MGEELQKNMSLLYNMFNKKQIDSKTLISRAVQLGMNYQEQKIKAGIDIVFDSLHKKNTRNTDNDLHN